MQEKEMLFMRHNELAYRNKTKPGTQPPPPAPPPPPLVSKITSNNTFNISEQTPSYGAHAQVRKGANGEPKLDASSRGLGTPTTVKKISMLLIIHNYYTVVSFLK